MIRQFPPITGSGYSGTSTTSIAMGTGTKVYTTQIGMAFVVGQRVIAIYDSTNYMEGYVVSYSGTTLTLNIYLVVGSGTYTSWILLAGGIIRGQRSIEPNNFTLDLTNTGSDFGTGFGGLISSIDFHPDSDGKAWAQFDLKNSDFVEWLDVVFDLHWIANGSIGSTLVSRVTMDIWALDAGATPTAGSPTATVTTDISIATTDTGKKKSSLSFITLPKASISATCDTIFFSIKREAIHANDTYTGTWQLLNIFAKQ